MQVALTCIGVRCSSSFCGLSFRSGRQRPWCLRNVQNRLFHHVTVPGDVVFRGDRRKEYLDLFPQIVADLTANYPDIPEANNWLAEVMKCNVLEGPDTTARLFLLAHRALAPGGELGAPYRMAWCLQMLDGSAMVCEELMRLDERRHEGDRWHHRGALGLRAANDGLLLESGMYELLRGYFQRESYYPRAVDTFQQVAQMAILGRCLDLRASEAAGEARLAMFNSQHLADIARHATAYPRLYLPLVLAAAMLSSLQDMRDCKKSVAKLATESLKLEVLIPFQRYDGGTSTTYLHGHRTSRKSADVLLRAGYEESLLGEASELILKIGVYGRFQDDVLGLAAGTRGGTAALELGRCTWPAVVTLQRATPRQRLALQNCYGCSGQDNVSAVKEIYAEVGIEELFADYKREEIKCLSSGVDKIQDENVRDLLRMIFEHCNHTNNNVVQKAQHFWLHYALYV